MSGTSSGPFRKSIFAEEPVLTPERRLWRAVLEQAYLDAEMLPEAFVLDEREPARAQHYLRADVPERECLTLVCCYAEIPFDRLVCWARKRYTVVADLDFEDLPPCLRQTANENPMDAPDLADPTATVQTL